MRYSSGATLVILAEISFEFSSLLFLLSHANLNMMQHKHSKFVTDPWPIIFSPTLVFLSHIVTLRYNIISVFLKMCYSVDVDFSSVLQWCARVMFRYLSSQSHKRLEASTRCRVRNHLKIFRVESQRVRVQSKELLSNFESLVCKLESVSSQIKFNNFCYKMVHNELKNGAQQA